ncbi:MAG: histidine phosphatase family protein [Chloroflexi bacterium]|nr:MAG: histidine phosphatase family protein [Chloroflexota bacterium]
MPGVRTRLYLVRHCDVHNPGRVLYGFLPGFGLSEKGVTQAHALGRHLAQQPPPIAQIYTSPLQRARETAEILASHLDGVPVVSTEELIEARFGRYLQGVQATQVPWRRPRWLVHMARPGLLQDDESVPEMAARVRAPLMRLLHDHPGRGGVCVSHGDPIQAFWVESDGRPNWSLHRLQCAKGGMLELDYENETLMSKTYRAPEELAAPASTARAVDAGHA